MSKTGAKQVTHRELKELLKIHMDVGLSLYVSAGPGIGKSSVVKDVAKDKAKKEGLNFVDWNELSNEMKEQLLLPAQQQQGLFSIGQPVKQSGINVKNSYIFVDMRLSQKEPTDLSGMPNVNGTSNITKWCPPLAMKVLSNPDAKGMLFLDELPNAPILTQNAAYSIVLDKFVGEISFSKNISVVGAGNRVSDNSQVFARPAALASRFTNYELKAPTVEDWVKDYAIPNGLDPRIIGFINSKPEVLAPEIHNLDSESFPCPRSISEAAKLINGISDLYTIGLLVSGKCGEGFGAEFSAYMALGASLDIDKILADPDANCPIDQGQRWFMLSGVIDRVKKAYANGTKGPMIKQYLKLMNKIDPDLALSTMTQMRREKIGANFLSDVSMLPEGQRYSELIRKLSQED